MNFGLYNTSFDKLVSYYVNVYICHSIFISALYSVLASLTETSDVGPTGEETNCFVNRRFGPDWKNKGAENFQYGVRRVTCRISMMGLGWTEKTMGTHISVSQVNTDVRRLLQKSPWRFLTMRSSNSSSRNRGGRIRNEEDYVEYLRANYTNLPEISEKHK